MSGSLVELVVCPHCGSRLERIDANAHVRVMAEVVTLAEAAWILDLNPATLRQSIARGALAAVKVGRDWTVTRAEVARYAAEVRRRP